MSGESSLKKTDQFLEGIVDLAKVQVMLAGLDSVLLTQIHLGSEC